MSILVFYFKTIRLKCEEMIFPVLRGKITKILLKNFFLVPNKFSPSIPHFVQQEKKYIFLCELP